MNKIAVQSYYNNLIKPPKKSKGGSLCLQILNSIIMRKRMNETEVLKKILTIFNLIQHLKVQRIFILNMNLNKSSAKVTCKPINFNRFLEVHLKIPLKLHCIRLLLIFYISPQIISILCKVKSSRGNLKECTEVI